MTIDELNQLDDTRMRAELQRCCGSRRWVDRMLEARPYEDREALFQACREAEGTLDTEDWLEAFGHHPRIGDMDSLRRKFADTADWAGNEQAGVEGAGDELLRSLKEQNDAYYELYGFIFIVCATGKGAAEMLEILQSRLGNRYEDEVLVAAGEQKKITRIRIDKLVDAA